MGKLDMKEIEKMFEDMNIQVKTNDPVYDVILKIAKKWNTLNNEEQKTIVNMLN